MLLRIEKSCDPSHDNSTIKRPIFGHRTSSLFSELRTPSLVCPALSLSSFEVKLALPATEWGRLGLWGPRSCKTPPGASSLIVKGTRTGYRVGGTCYPATTNGLSGRDAVPPQRKFGKSKLAARCLTDIVKRPMPCSVLQCSSWKQEVAKAKRRLAWSLKDRSKPRLNSPVLSPKTRRSAGGLFNETRSDGGASSLWTMEMVRGRSPVVLKHEKLSRLRSSVSLNHESDQRAKFCCSETHQSFREQNSVIIQHKKAKLSVNA